MRRATHVGQDDGRGDAVLLVPLRFCLQHKRALASPFVDVPSVLVDLVHDQHVPENSHQDVVDERPGLAIRSHLLEELREQVLLLRRSLRIGRDARALLAGLHRNRGVVLVRARYLQDIMEEVVLSETFLTYASTTG